MNELDYCQHEGQYAWWENDAQGIPLCKVCEICVAHKLSKYRPEILEFLRQDTQTYSSFDETLDRLQRVAALLL